MGDENGLTLKKGKRIFIKEMLIQTQLKKKNSLSLSLHELSSPHSVQIVLTEDVMVSG